jgi:hypothetical protein
MLKKTINTGYELLQEFQAYGRDYFTYEACEEIINYFDMFEEDVELDIIGLCCDFNESTIDDIRSDYNIDYDTDVIEYLNENTYATQTVDNKILYIAF